MNCMENTGLIGEISVVGKLKPNFFEHQGENIFWQNLGS